MTRVSAMEAMQERLPGRGATMEGASEYVFVAEPGAAFGALRAVVLERRLAVLPEDALDRRLAFRPAGPADAQITALCAILDVGHGLSKLVVVCVDEADGSVVAPDPSFSGLFMHVEHTLHTAWGNRNGVALPPVIEVEQRFETEEGEARALALPPLQIS
jgi:hypothetical protein